MYGISVNRKMVAGNMAKKKENARDVDLVLRCSFRISLIKKSSTV
jgi:hypothetical protein